MRDFFDLIGFLTYMGVYIPGIRLHWGPAFLSGAQLSLTSSASRRSLTLGPLFFVAKATQPCAQAELGSSSSRGLAQNPAVTSTASNSASA